MISIVVHGVSSGISQDVMEEMIADYQSLVAGIKELKITRRQISVFFPQDLCKKGLGEEIVILVSGMRATKGMIRRVINFLGLITRQNYFPKALIVCIAQSTSFKLTWSSDQPQ